MPPDVRRGFFVGTMDIPDAAFDARYKRSYAKMVEFVGRLYPSVSPRRMNSGSQAGHKSTTASRGSKRSKAKCRDRVRTVGASLHPWGLTGCRYASGRGGTTGRSATPSHRTHRPAHHPINDTREASQLSDLSPYRGALQPAQRRPEAERNERATGRESSLLERPKAVVMRIPWALPSRQVATAAQCWALSRALQRLSAF